MVYDAIWDSPLTAALAECADAYTKDAASIVDLGCGTGLMTGNRSARVTGVDGSAAMLRRALRHQRVGTALHSRLDATELPARSADAVLLCNVLHLHPDPTAVLREAERLCGPDGTVFMCWPLDGIDTQAAYCADRRLGRGWASAYIAHSLRSIIGIAAALAHTRRHPSTFVEETLFGANGLEVVHDTILAGCQRVVVARKASHSSC